MPSSYLLLSLLFVASFSLATLLQPLYQSWEGSRTSSTGVINVLFGDSRRMFANHFFVEADIYFHNGYYPSIFDQGKLHESSPMAQTIESGGKHEHDSPRHDDHEKERKSDFMGQPKDWIDRFGRNFYASEHTHLEKNGDEREILPWLRLSAELDPKRVESYTVAAYWLRNRLGKVKEAEQFLREGLRANPQSYEILFELGRVAFENRKDSQTARNLLELALRRWREQQEGNSEPDILLHQRIIGHLVEVEEQAGNWDAAKKYLEELKTYSPAPQEIQKQIDEITQKNTLPSTPQPAPARDDK